MNPENRLVLPQQNPFQMEVPRPPHFRTTCELLRNLEKAWKLFKQISIDPVFRTPSDDPLLDEDIKKSIFMELGSDTFTNICTKWATNEDLTFDIPQFFFDKLQAYVKKQCKALHFALQREDNDVIIDVTYQKSRKYWVIINYLEEYFIYFESVQSHTVRDTEHDVDMSRTRFMMSLMYKHEVFEPLSKKLRKIALDSLERKRKGDESASYNVRMFERLIDLVSISKGFTDSQWDFFLRENCFMDLISKARLFHDHCLCHFVDEVASKVHEVLEYGVGATTLFCFRIMIFPMVQHFFFEDDARIIHLVKVEARNALKNLCGAFGYEQEMMKKIANIIEKYVRETVIVKLKQSIQENPDGTFTHLFFIWVKIVVLSIMNLHHREYEVYIIAALTEPFYPIISEHEELLWETLPAYFCKRLTKREEGVENFGRPVDVELEAAVVLLEKLPDVDGLLDNLITKLFKSSSRMEFSRLHVDYLLKALMTYFPDVPKAYELKRFLILITNQEKTLVDFSPTLSPWRQIPDPNLIPIQGVKAVQKADWPQGCSGNIKLPAAMRQAFLSYSCFFHLKHKDKDFEYNFSHDTVTVTTSLFSKGPEEIDIHMTTHQMSFLDLFQERDSLSVSQFLEALQYRNENDETPMTFNSIGAAEIPDLVERVLQSLMSERYPLITKTPAFPLIHMDDILSLNRLYFPRSKELMLPMP